MSALFLMWHYSQMPKSASTRLVSNVTTLIPSDCDYFHCIAWRAMAHYSNVVRSLRFVGTNTVSLYCTKIQTSLTALCITVWKRAATAQKWRPISVTTPPLVCRYCAFLMVRLQDRVRWQVSATDANKKAHTSSHLFSAALRVTLGLGFIPCFG